MNFALVLAAGSGTRMNNKQPKQFLMVNNKPLFYYSVESFNRNKDIDAIVIVTNNEYIEQVQNWCIEYNLCKVKSVVKGGQTRQESVYNGLQELSKIVDNPKDLVLIHDSARPLVAQRIINENISVGKEFGAADTVIHATDTIIKSKNEKTIDEILNRSELYQTQTPQTFEFGIIKNAHERAKIDNIPDVTDDCKLVLHYGKDVHFVMGDKFSFKVTTPEDLEILKMIIKPNDDK